MVRALVNAPHRCRQLRASLVLATNPNNWHWKEKNATQWSKDKLNDLLVGLQVENEQFICEIKELKRCEGEASANNRKAKLVFLVSASNPTDRSVSHTPTARISSLQYEWQIEGKWEGSVRTGENRTKFEGTFDVPNLSDENEIHEVNITFSVEKSKGDKLKEMMRKDGEPIIRQRLGEYVRLLKEEFSQGLILPTKTSTTITTNSKASSTVGASTASTTSKSSTSANQTSNSNLETRELTVQDTFKCSRSDLFQAFTDMNMVKAFTQNSVSQYDCKQGGQFSLFGDNITGHFIDILPCERIEMLWRFKSWPKEHYSHVTMLFHEDTEQTKLVIEQTGVPTQFYDNTMVSASHETSDRDFRVLRLSGRMAALLFREYQINIRLRIAAPLDTNAASGMLVFSLFRTVLLLVLPIRSK